MQNSSDGKGTASLVLGIISLVFIFFGYFAIVGMILAIISLVIGISAKTDIPNDGKAKAGVILSIVSLALSALTLIACKICLSSLAFLPLY